MERVPITREGYEALKKELEYIKKVERPRNIKAIEEARAHGDITENAEFEAAKDRQAFIEGKLNELGYKISMADIIDPQKRPWNLMYTVGAYDKNNRPMGVGKLTWRQDRR